MKTATAFLVAVTVFTSLFLESSTAPNPFLEGLTSNLGKVVTGASQSVGGVVSGTGKVLGGVVSGTGMVVDGVIVDVGQTVDGLVSDTGKVVKGVVGGVDTLVTGVGEVVVGKVFADIETVTQAVGKIVKDVTGLLGGLLGTVKSIEGELGEKLKKTLAKVETTLGEVIELAQNIAAEDATDTVKELDGLLKKAVKKLNARLAAVTDIVKQISEKAGYDASVVVNEVKAVVAEVTEGVKNILSNVADAVKSKTSKAVDGAEKLDNSALGQLLEKEIKITEAALAEFKKTIDDILATATDAEKEMLAAVVDFLKEFVPFVNGIHEKLREDVKVNNHENRKKMIQEQLGAIEHTKTQVASLIKTQGDKVKEALEKNILKTIVNVASVYVKELQKTLSA